MDRTYKITVEGETQIVRDTFENFGKLLTQLTNDRGRSGYEATPLSDFMGTTVTIAEAFPYVDMS